MCSLLRTLLLEVIKNNLVFQIKKIPHSETLPIANQTVGNVNNSSGHSSTPIFIFLTLPHSEEPLNFTVYSSVVPLQQHYQHKSH